MDDDGHLADTASRRRSAEDKARRAYFIHNFEELYSAGKHMSILDNLTAEDVEMLMDFEDHVC